MKKLCVFILFIVLFSASQKSLAATAPSFEPLSAEALESLYRDAHFHPFYPNYTEEQRKTFLEERKISELGRIKQDLERQKLPQTSSEVLQAFYERGEFPLKGQEENYAIMITTERFLDPIGKNLGISSVATPKEWEMALKGDKPLLFFSGPAPFYTGYLLDPKKMKAGNYPYLCIDALIQGSPYAGEFFKLLMREAKTYPNVQALFASFNDLSPSSILEGLNEIRGSTALKSIDIAGNLFSEGAESLGPLLSSFPSLIDFSIGITASQANQMASSLSGLSIQSLYIEVQDIKGEEDSLGALVSQLQGMTSLNNLRIMFPGASKEFLGNFIQKMLSTSIKMLCTSNKEMGSSDDEPDDAAKCQLKKEFSESGKELVFFGDSLPMPDSEESHSAGLYALHDFRIWAKKVSFQSIVEGTPIDLTLKTAGVVEDIASLEKVGDHRYKLTHNLGSILFLNDVVAKLSDGTVSAEPIGHLEEFSTEGVL